MMHSHWRVAPLFASLLLASTIAFTNAAAQTAAATKEYTPSPGQEGKDVIWMPTPLSLIERMLTMARVTPSDYVIDLGSGDGRTVIAAAKKGASALGIEYNPDMVELAKRNAEKEGVAGKAQFIKADIFATDFSKATVLTMYLLPSLNLKLRPTILNMRPGTRVVSHAFTMDDWEPDQREISEARTAYMWIVPAKVAGTWKVDVSGGGVKSYEATFLQQYQTIGGSAKADGKPVTFGNGKLRGDAITFSIDDGGARRDFTGRVIGDRMEGTVAGASHAKFTATRTGGAK